MTWYTKQILDRYREIESLDSDARLRVTRALKSRIGSGETSHLGINVDPPALPLAQSAISFSAGSVAVKVGVAVVVVATSAALGWRVWVARHAGERAPDAPGAAALVVSAHSFAQQRPLATKKADQSKQPLPPAQRLLTAAQSSADKRPFPKPTANRKPRSPTRPRQKAAIAPDEGTTANTGIPEVTDRLNSIATDLTNNPAQIEGETNAIEEKQIATELQTKAEQPRSDPDASPPPRQNPPSTLDEEMKLLRAAHSALRAGKPEQALAQLAEHTWRFPKGELAEPRDVAHIMALCHAGKVEASRLEAKRFLAQRPSSPFAGRVRAFCVERPKASR